MSAPLVWPTHRAKATARKKQQSARKRRNRRERKILRSGKRGVVTPHESV